MHRATTQGLHGPGLRRRGEPSTSRRCGCLASGLLVQPWWAPGRLRVEIADGVLVRHRVRIHWPWKLSIGEDSWIGEATWILNLEPVRIGRDVCVSQGVLLCTGSHDRRSPTFEFDDAPIEIEDGAWVAARATVLRGVTVGHVATVGATALVTHDVDADSVLLAAPATTRAGSVSAR